MKTKLFPWLVFDNTPKERNEIIPMVGGPVPNLLADHQPSEEPPTIRDKKAYPCLVFDNNPKERNGIYPMLGGPVPNLLADHQPSEIKNHTHVWYLIPTQKND
jgi:hypothetical protein